MLSVEYTIPTIKKNVVYVKEKNNTHRSVTVIIKLTNVIDLQLQTGIHVLEHELGETALNTE